MSIGVYAVTGQVTYQATTAAASSQVTKSHNFDPLTDAPIVLDLTRTSTGTVVPGSVYFTLAGKTYLDRSGVIYTDLQSNGSGTEAGSINYQTGEVTLNVWNSNAVLGITVTGCLMMWGTWVASEASFRTAGSPLRAASAYVQVTAEDGAVITATCNEQGTIVSDNARGTVNQDMGIVDIQWGAMVAAAGNENADWYDAANVVGGMIWKPRRVLPSTIRYNCVVLSNLPLSAAQLGLEPVRLPTDGRVPIFRAGDVVVIHNTKDFALPNPPVAGTSYNVGRVDLSELWIVDANGARVDASKYVDDLAGGTVTMAANLDLTGAALPWTAKHRIEQVDLLTDVQINGELGLSASLGRDFDIDTHISSALLFGDMFARVTNVFDQTTWTGAWSDSRIGTDSAATYDTIDFPIIVQNDGAVTERWRINFVSPTAFQLIGEDLGVIANGVTTQDLTPVNPLTGKPYFTLKAAGWGIGWAAGVQLRFNTIGATAPIWIARTVLPGASLTGDSLDMQLRGDVDA